MANNDWNKFDDLDDDDLNQKLSKEAKSKYRKRKFREIEMIKEKHRLGRELSELDDSFFDVISA